MRALKQSEVRVPGNPNEKTDFYIEPKTNEVFDFIRFARTLPRGINTLGAFRLAPSVKSRRIARKFRQQHPTGRGRLSKHFDKDGDPSETLLKARQERFENWRTLPEPAGII